ncbi:MAG: hypothetical protein [Microviridae sp.]|nr:MAG: hypothetical protein [Microviridae sp.]
MIARPTRPWCGLPRSLFTAAPFFEWGGAPIPGARAPSRACCVRSMGNWPGKVTGTLKGGPRRRKARGIGRLWRPISQSADALARGGPRGGTRDRAQRETAVPDRYS